VNPPSVVITIRPVLDADGRTFVGLVCLDHTSEGFCGG